MEVLKGAIICGGGDRMRKRAIAGEREATSGGGERLLVEGSDRKWRVKISAGGKRSQVEGPREESQVE